MENVKNISDFKVSNDGNNNQYQKKRTGKYLLIKYMIQKRRARAFLLYSLHSNNLGLTVGKVRERRPISPNLI